MKKFPLIGVLIGIIALFWSKRKAEPETASETDATDTRTGEGGGSD